jgi:hypothetical protein
MRSIEHMNALNKQSSIAITPAIYDENRNDLLYTTLGNIGRNNELNDKKNVEDLMRQLKGTSPKEASILITRAVQRHPKSTILKNIFKLLLMGATGVAITSLVMYPGSPFMKDMIALGTPLVTALFNVGGRAKAWVLAAGQYFAFVKKEPTTYQIVKDAAAKIPGAVAAAGEKLGFDPIGQIWKVAGAGFRGAKGTARYVLEKTAEKLK